MGLIRAGAGALGGTMADQWKEFFYCDAIDKDTLVVKGAKRTSSRSSNTKGNDNIISSGSGIDVADGQCMIIVEQGKVVEVCAEPGQFTYDASTEPSIFSGSLGQAILDTFKTIGKRFTFGGDTGKDQRVYYFNTKEIVDNRFGTATPIPFRIVDNRIGLDTDTEVRCNGVYSYKITNPLLFYTNVCGNVEQTYERSEIDSQLKSEFVSALQPAFARLSTFEMRPNQIPAHTIELCDLMNETLTRKWSELRGISVVSIAMNSVSIPEEDAEKLKELQRAAALANPALAAGAVIGAQTDAMRTAAWQASWAWVWQLTPAAQTLRRFTAWRQPSSRRQLPRRQHRHSLLPRGPAPAARLQQIISAPSAASLVRPALRDIGAISAAGSLPISRSRRSSARNAATRSTTTIRSDAYGNEEYRSI